MANLWLIGGTQESRQVLTGILATAHPPTIVVTVTTPGAIALYPSHPLVQVWVGKLTAAGALSFIQNQDITAILDASHPFATEISQRAIALAQDYDLPYLRYERPPAPAPSPWRDRRDRPGFVPLPQWSAVLQPQYLTPEDRTLVTVGTRWLQDLQPWQERTTLFARILPQPDALAAAISAGFPSPRLIALRPPISPEVETALWHQWGITQVVTKASGAPGGEPEKQAIAAQLGVRLLVITRPQLPYPAQTTDLAMAIAFGAHVP